MGWIQRQMSLDVNPEDILTYMVPHAQLPPNLDKSTLWKIIIDILTEPTPRQKIDHINSLDDVVELLRGSKNIIVLTGAGEIYPGQFKPSLSHKFIRQLELNGQLLKNYSQNIDTLEQIAGISRVIQCHGSFSTASCTNCKYQVSCEVIREDIFHQVIPLCPKCPQDGSCFAIMKPDIVFFGESLPSEFYHNLDEDSEKADLLVVIGSSLKVRPVALIPSHVPPEVPQVLINREPLRHMTFDVELLGDCDVIISELCQRLGGTWTSLLDDFESPCVQRGRRSSPEKTNSTIEVESDALGEKETAQTPQNAPNSESSTLSDVTQGRESAGAPNRPEGHVTVGESSGCEETSDESCRDQPRASGSEEDNEDSTNRGTSCDEDSPQFIFMAPSRYIFYGAEVMDSPLPSPSPSRNMTTYLDSTSDESDSDSVGEIDDNEACGDQFDRVIDDLIRIERSADNDHQTTTNNGGSQLTRSSESESNSDDGFGEGDVDKALETSNNEVTKQALSLILGGLSSYTCASEENSRLSAGSDDPVSAGPSDPRCLSKAAETLLTDRPFSVVTMDTTLTKRDQPEIEDQDRIEDTKTGDSDGNQRSDGCLQLETEINATSDEQALHS